MADEATQTFWVCVRCIAYFASGGFKYNGKYGCCFLPNSISNLRHLRAWRVKATYAEDTQTMRCMRCFFINSDCFCLPKEFDGELDEIATQMGILTAADNDAEAKRAAEVEIQRIAAQIIKSLSPDYVPQASKLCLHSGAINKNGEPETDAYANARSRSTVNVSAKQEAKKRLFEEKAAAEVQSPRKQAKTIRENPKRDALAQADEMKTRLDALVADKMAANGRVEKAKIQKKIRALTLERTAKLAEAAQL
ncbi:hypothetical protein G6514_001988 [Epicoccum nigrum]|nr:hypothetical protein G6514_001988 [Epicoccum nigrum]